MCRWTLNDINWGMFDSSKVDNKLLEIVRAASMVEYRSADYTAYLSQVFVDDENFCADILQWGSEEKQHGLALAKWASIADVDFDFDASFSDFEKNYNLPLSIDRSIRGSRTGELLSRCVVEIGTSSFYSAIADASREPVLRQICTLIARDEFAHYGLFRRHMERYQLKERIGLWPRVSVAIGRFLETSDDELSYAFYAANRLSGVYERKSAGDAYASRALKLYRRKHVRKGMRMLLRAIGLRRQRFWRFPLAMLAYWILRLRAWRAQDIIA